eukprot:g2395.t1
MTTTRSPLVSAQWALEHFAKSRTPQALAGGAPSSSAPTSKRVVFVDATWYLPNSPYACPEPGKTGLEMWQQRSRLPHSCFLDLDACADTSSGLPHTMPPPRLFEEYMQTLGIRNEDLLVCYDRLGIFSAARAWFMFRHFGHSDSFVLDGGQPAWEAAGGEVVSDRVPVAGGGGAAAPSIIPVGSSSGDQSLLYSVDKNASKPASSSDPEADPTGRPNNYSITPFCDVQEIAKGSDRQLVDARAAPRFTGEAAEPRPGMRSGHVPGSVNVPFGSLLEGGGCMKPVRDLQGIFEKAGVDLTKPIVATCGSGMTANIVLLAAEVVNTATAARAGEAAPQLSLYDGSWVEYQGKPEAEVATGP